jgi:hypothetical protein
LTFKQSVYYTKKRRCVEKIDVDFTKGKIRQIIYEIFEEYDSCC